MSDSRNILREIAWRELFPWLLLVRTFRVALQPAILVVALVAAIATPLGWRLSQWIFRIPPVATAEDVDASHQILAGHARELGRLPGHGRLLSADLLLPLRDPWSAFSDRSPMVFVFHRYSQPLFGMYQTDFSADRAASRLPQFAYYLFGTLWTLAVWSFAGGFITRIAAIELGREEQARLGSAARLVMRRWVELFTAPLYPVLGTFLIAILLLPIGLLLWSSDVGVLLGSLVWIFVLLGGAFSALLLLWLLVGWPLMWPAIMAQETGDAFEAMSRSYSYAFQRPLHYLFYAALACVLGLICWTLVDFLCFFTINLGHWLVSWGAGTPRLKEIFSAVPDAAHSQPLRVGASIIVWTEGLFLALSEAFAYSFFWVSATAIYLLLRQNVDNAELDEVWLQDETPRYPLRPATSTPATQPPATVTAPALSPDSPEPPTSGPVEPV